MTMYMSSKTHQHNQFPLNGTTHSAVEHKTPYYQYNLAVLRRRIEEFCRSFSADSFQLLYATMANDNVEILREISSCNVGACVNSLHHLDLVASLGFNPSLIQFTSTCIPREVMSVLQQRDIRANLDSLSQIAQWLEMSPSSDFGLRINASSLKGFTEGDRIGVHVFEIPQAISLANAYHAKLIGLHVYVGTNFQSPDLILPTLRALFDKASSVPTLEYINIGGGVGIDYQHTDREFNIDMFGREVSSMRATLAHRMNKDIHLFFEPGRSLIAEAGVFVVTIIDVKRLNEVVYVGVDASIAIFPRPFHHPESVHCVRRLNRVTCASLTNVVIVGQTTFSKDILAKCKLPNDLAVGDTLEFSDAGAYCQSMQSRFLGQATPQSFY